MNDREQSRIPYTLWFFLMGFLAGVLTLVLRCRRTLISPAPDAGANASPARPQSGAILLPESMPGGALPPPDDLTLIEGIGPRVQEVLRSAGVRRLSQLARMTPAQIKKLLVAAGNRISNPETWPEQARLAAAARWDQLKALQATLKAGRKA